MKTKSIRDIMTRLIDLTMINTTEINDFTPGSVIRSVYESVAMELEQYYVLTEENIKWGIEQGIFEAFGFHRRPARRAYGKVQINFHTALQHGMYIPSGTMFKSSYTGMHQQYETIEPYYVPAGASTAIITVYCTESGTVGNVPRGTINLLMSNLNFVQSVSNIEDFLTGSEQEKLENVRERFQEFIETRGRATKRAIKYGAKQVDDIVGVHVAEEAGLIHVYAHDRNGNLSDKLKVEVEERVEDYRPAGIPLKVHPVERIDIDFDIEVYVTTPSMKSDAFRDEITRIVRDYLNRKTTSDELYLSDVIQLIMNVDDHLIYDCKITNMEENMIVEDHQLIRAGDIRVTLV